MTLRTGRKMPVDLPARTVMEIHIAFCHMQPAGQIQKKLK